MTTLRLTSVAPSWRSSPCGEPHVVEQHHFHNKESPAAPVLSTKAEESTSPNLHPHHVLQTDYREHPVQPYHCLVWELHCLGSQDPAADSENSKETHWLLSSLHRRHLHFTLPPQSCQHCGRPYAPLSHTLYPPAFW